MVVIKNASLLGLAFLLGAATGSALAGTPAPVPVLKMDSFAAVPNNFNMAITTEAAICSPTGLQGFTIDGLVLTCQDGRMSRTGTSRAFETTAQTVRDWCDYDGAMYQYDYIRYATTCGSRLCAGLNHVYGFKYQFGLVTEIGVGFNYPTPYLSAPATKVSVQCVQ